MHQDETIRRRLNGSRDDLSRLDYGTIETPDRRPLSGSPCFFKEQA